MTEVDGATKLANFAALDGSRRLKWRTEKFFERFERTHRLRSGEAKILLLDTGSRK